MTWEGRDGWQQGGRTTPLPPNWDSEIRPRILERDGHVCQWWEPDDDGIRKYSTDRLCGEAATDVDHIGDNADHSDANLRALCKHHHAQHTAKQGSAAALARRWKYKRQRAPERHPGLIYDDDD